MLNFRGNWCSKIRTLFKNVDENLSIFSTFPSSLQREVTLVAPTKFCWETVCLAELRGVTAVLY
jgi:hypothetical protein